MGKLIEEKFVCIDCETTGLDSKQDKIIEVAVTVFTFNEIIEQFETLIDPGIEIPASSIEIHNISMDMVKGKPKINEILGNLFKIIKNYTIIGHGIKFDIDILLEEAKRHSIPCHIGSNPTIDTLRLARLNGDSPSNALSTLGLHFNVESDGIPHRAGSDVKVNIEVFKHLSRKYHTLKELNQALKRPILLKNMPLGKHKGRAFREIPLPYLKWASHQNFDEDLLFSIRSELNKRKKGSNFYQAGNPFMELDLA